ncbi:MAG: molybdate ABC transporter permease subunit [Chloroflexota bacterium]|nr:molybdate ABC transporter permease subunit [Chloroflexota bacterium]MED5450722.1 molybdate ABC transporter permease subunit [Chloroflexota bacterium]
MVELILLSIKVAAVATLINIPIAVYIGWLIGRRNIRGKLILETVISLPLALPPVVTGYFLLILVGRESAIGQISQFLFGNDIVFTWVASAIAASVVSFPLMVRAIIVAMQGVDTTLERSARSLGAGPIRTFLQITLPLCYNGLVAGILLGFVRAIGEFGATIVVAGNIPGRTQTIPLAIYSKVQLGKDSEAINLIIISTVLAIITLIIHHWLIVRGTRKSQR